MQLALEPRVTFAAGGTLREYHGLSGVTLEARAAGAPDLLRFLVDHMLDALVQWLDLSQPVFAIDLKYEGLPEQCSFAQPVVLPVDWNDPIESYRFCCCGAEPQVSTKRLSDVVAHVATHPDAWSCCGCGLTISNLVHFECLNIHPQSISFTGMSRLPVLAIRRLHDAGESISDRRIADAALSQRTAPTSGRA